tara:strand:- start:117 stop:986 length:870 start_codon:yes stop_codon:yes gene_type:complete
MFVKNEYYKRQELHDKYGGRPQYGISNCPQHPIIFIFSGKTGKQHGYEDGWDDEKYFSYSGEGQKGDMTFTGGNKSLQNHIKNKKSVFLFEKTKQSGFWKFIDELKLVDYGYYPIKYKDENKVQRERRGIKFKFLSISHDSVKKKIEKDESDEKKYNYNKPNKTERKGLVTSRVGQGYYRQQILDKWNNKCGVTGSSLVKILISSHIVPWSKCNDEERLDPENGILLSPNIDSLFDRHLISFKDTGEIIISNKLTSLELKKLGVNNQMKLSHVSKGMKTYLLRHRKQLK